MLDRYSVPAARPPWSLCLSPSDRCARQTQKLLADVRAPTFGRGDPMTNGPWRIMSNMLLMPALKFSDPFQIFILVKTDNFSWQTLRLALRFHFLLSG